MRDLKEKVFQKEREEGKNVRLIYQGKVLQDADLLEKYGKVYRVIYCRIGLKDGVFVHAFITEGVPKPVSEQSVDGRVNTSNSSETEERYGFDRLLFNNAYSEIEVHAIRLQFHAIMMRVGIEKTNETSESLLENEERWLNKQLPGPNSKFANMSLDELRKMPTVLSKRNDLVLPRFYH